MFSASAGKRTTTRAQLAIRLMFLCEVNMRLINRSKQSSYVATAMSCARRLHHLPGQCN
ncbi:hypothetical protein DJ518_08705 [Klebsiella pneumoniae]|uniref:DUF4060 family protein n=1 Tax=Klebsiella pneumoniae TaxID=573 RepID=UPI0011E458DF|nr:DUF4060 family protein [Klebsiella pneumoniae]TYE03290.1 hypothetical protein DJ518_08705 [Klebsiella pneumoniae]